LHFWVSWFPTLSFTEIGPNGSTENGFNIGVKSTCTILGGLWLELIKPEVIVII
jgi:hypothetical protein